METQVGNRIFANVEKTLDSKRLFYYNYLACVKAHFFACHLLMNDKAT